MQPAICWDWNIVHYHSLQINWINFSLQLGVRECTVRVQVVYHNFCALLLWKICQSLHYNLKIEKYSNVPIRILSPILDVYINSASCTLRFSSSDVGKIDWKVYNLMTNSRTTAKRALIYAMTRVRINPSHILYACISWYMTREFDWMSTTLIFSDTS